MHFLNLEKKLNCLGFKILLNYGLGINQFQGIDQTACAGALNLNSFAVLLFGNVCYPDEEYKKNSGSEFFVLFRNSMTVVFLKILSPLMKQKLRAERKIRFLILNELMINSQFQLILHSDNLFLIS